MKIKLKRKNTGYFKFNIEKYKFFLEINYYFYSLYINNNESCITKH